MFKKLSNSLLSPKEVAKYHNEPAWKTILFFIILLLFIMIPNIIALSVSPLLSGSSEKVIKKAFSSENIPFKIVDGKLSNVNGDHDFVYVNPYFYEIKVAFTEDEENCKNALNEGINNPLEVTYIVFHDEGIVISNPLVGKMRFSYNNFSYFKNLDFSNKDLIRTVDFWDNIFFIANTIFHDVKAKYVVMSSLNMLFELVINMVVFVLIVTLFAKLRMGRYISFGKIFKISIYCLTPYVFCILFSSIFGFGFLRYIGFALAAIFNIITVNELMKDLYLKRKEGE